MQKAKCTAGCDFRFEIFDGFQAGMLRTQYRTIKIDQCGDLVIEGR